MHEASLVRTLLDKVATLLKEHQGEAVEEVCIELGPLSGVEPLLVQSAFEMLAPQYSLSDAKLIIHEIPLEAKCRDCGALFEIKNFRFRCELCESSAVQVVRGDEFRLLNITIRQAVDNEASA
ncbi:MAG: hydrogenase nickel incorporation protein [Planctomycetaceae bacterium]|nr:hydrogenase nickel incorporation protein [Planctomycetaceae bacterium]